MLFCMVFIGGSVGLLYKWLKKIMNLEMKKGEGETRTKRILKERNAGIRVQREQKKNQARMSEEEKRGEDN